MRTAKSRNKHVAKISCDKVVTALLKLLCVDADFLTTNTQARIPLWLNRRVLISPFSSKSAAQRNHYVSVKVECNSLTWQMSTLCGLPWTYIIKLCNLHALCDFYQAFKVCHRCNTKTVKRRHKSFSGGLGCPPPENVRVWRVRNPIFSTYHEICLRKIDLEPENGKQLQVTIIKLTESKENNSIHRLDVSGSTGPRGAAAPLGLPASYGSGK